MPKTNKKYHNNISFNVTAEEIHNIEYLMDKLHITKSEIIREGLRRVFKDYGLTTTGF